MLDTPPPSGFLKAIFPCLRKGSGGSQGSMAWVKLVDDEGRVAGHAVLSARISMALLGGAVRGRNFWAGRLPWRVLSMACIGGAVPPTGGHPLPPAAPVPV